MVEKVAMPLAAGVQVYQTELLPGLPACSGSPNSREASVFEP